MVSVVEVDIEIEVLDDDVVSVVVDVVSVSQ